MTPTPTRIDRAALSEAVAKLALADGPVRLGEHIDAFRAPGPLRLSSSFLGLWCSSTGPSAEVDAWLRERGLEIVPAMDADGGWEVRRMTEGGLW